jgi:short-subunit dehydrogenase
MRMRQLAGRLRNETGVDIDIIKADLTEKADLSRVEQRLREDARIGVRRSPRK